MAASPILHPCAKLTHKIAAAAAAVAAAAKISARRRHGKKDQDFSENLENEKIAKNIEKIDENPSKHGFWRSYEKTDVTIKFYAKNYPYRLIFKSVRLEMAENMLLNVCKRCIRSLICT